MLGAITGDIIGSVYEWHNIKTKGFPLFSDNCEFTDDSVMTIAIAEGLMNGGRPDDYINAMKRLGRMYPKAGYGGRFNGWLRSDTRVPYNSWGNGSAMRVSPVGWVFDSLAETEKAAEVSAAVTHNHPEGIKGAKAAASAIFLARTGKIKAEIKAYIENTYGYDLKRTLAEIRPSYSFNESCQGTVPEAIIAFLESGSFEDAIRNAISLGGDSDTLAAITGSIAEAAYGIPEEIEERVLSMLPPSLFEIVKQWREAFMLPIDTKETCCLFSCSTANEAMQNRDFEVVEVFGGEGEGYSWGDGSRKLCQCRNCGALFLNYKMRFLAMSYDSNDISYIYFLPVTSRSEALEYMDMYIGSVGLKTSYTEKKIWFDGLNWCWNKQAGCEDAGQ